MQAHLLSHHLPRLQGHRRSEYINQRISLVLGFATLVLSILIYPKYYLGDQFFYRLFYATAQHTPFPSMLALQEDIISSSEPVYAVTVYLASRVFEKDVFFSMLNGVLAYSACVFYLRLGAHPLLVGVLTLLNFYSFAMYFAAERQKLGLLLFLLAANSRGSWKYVYIVLAPMAHSMILGLYLSVGAASTRIWHRVGLYWKGAPYRTAFVLMLMAIGAYYFAGHQIDHIARKWASYESPAIENLARALVFFATALYLARNKVAVCAAMAPLLAVIFFLGGSDINILVFYVLLYFAVQRNAGVSVPMICIMAYFAYTGLIFLHDTIVYGKGFA